MSLQLTLTGQVRDFLLASPRPLFILNTAELGSVFYSVKEKNFDDRGSRRQADREFSRKAELEMEMAKQREE